MSGYSVPVTRDASRPRRAVPAIATLTAVAALSLSGCSWMSPVQTQETYVPGDGVNATLKDLRVTNLLIVAPDKGERGVVLGQVANTGDQDLDVTIAGPGGTGRLTKKVAAGTAINLQEADFVLSSVEQAPGGMEKLQISTPASGAQEADVPVLANEGIYATISPTAVPSSSAPAATATATATETAVPMPTTSATN